MLLDHKCWHGLPVAILLVYSPVAECPSFIGQPVAYTGECKRLEFVVPRVDGHTPSGNGWPNRR